MIPHLHIDPAQLLSAWHMLIKGSRTKSLPQASAALSPLAWLPPLTARPAHNPESAAHVEAVATTVRDFIDDLARAWAQYPVTNDRSSKAVWENFLSLASQRYHAFSTGDAFTSALRGLIDELAGGALGMPSNQAARVRSDGDDVADESLKRMLDNLASVTDSRPLPAERNCILQTGTMRVFRYEPLGEPRVMPPLLIVYALVNTPDILDLDPERSLVRRLLAQGVPVYLIDWGFPKHQHRNLGLANYVDDLLDAAVQATREDAAAAKVDLLGVCQGGVFSLAYCALNPALVRRLALLVTPVEFHSPDNILQLWSRGIDFDGLTQRIGNIPGAALYWLFSSLRPYELIGRKYLHAMDAFQSEGNARRFMRMEHWIHNVPDHAGRAFAEFAKQLYQENALINDKLTIGRRRVQLSRIEAPVLNIYGQHDHIVPAGASRALAQYIKAPCQQVSREAGHIGIMVSRRHCQPVAEEISRWLIA